MIPILHQNLILGGYRILFERCRAFATSKSHGSSWIYWNLSLRAMNQSASSAPGISWLPRWSRCIRCQWDKASGAARISPWGYRCHPRRRSARGPDPEPAPGVPWVHDHCVFSHLNLLFWPRYVTIVSRNDLWNICPLGMAEYHRIPHDWTNPNHMLHRKKAQNCQPSLKRHSKVKYDH